MVFLRCGVRFPWRILEKSRLPTVTLEGSRDFLRVFSRSSVSHLFLSTETPVDGDDGGDGVKCVCSACVGCVCVCVCVFVCVVSTNMRSSVFFSDISMWYDTLITHC